MIIDLSYLKTMAGEDQAFIKEIFDIFAEQINEYSIKLPELLEKEDYEQLSKVAHKATSTLAIIGMEHDSKMLKELELKAKEQIDIDSYAGIIESFIENSKIAIIEFEDLLNKE